MHEPVVKVWPQKREHGLWHVNASASSARRAAPSPPPAAVPNRAAPTRARKPRREERSATFSLSARRSSGIHRLRGALPAVGRREDAPEPAEGVERSLRAHGPVPG